MNEDYNVWLWKQWERQMRRVGVEPIDLSRGVLECMDCGQRWMFSQKSSNERKVRRMYNLYYICPNGCNNDKRIR